MVAFYLVSLALIVYLALKYVYSYWNRNGYPSVQPIIPFGNLLNVVLAKSSFGLEINEIFENTKGRFVGIYLFFRPALLVRDAYLAKAIMTSDFSSFHDRGVYCDEKNDPMSANLFALPGQDWRNLRNKLTPTFSSGKLKNMLPMIMDIGKRLQDQVETSAHNKEIVEFKDLMARYVVDIIASVIFGVEVDTIKNPENEFRDVGRTLTTTGILPGLRAAATFVCPGLLKFTKIPSLPRRISQFMIDLVRNTVEYREKNNITRQDFMQLLIEMRSEDNKLNMKSMSVEQCAAQVFLFYIAGSESSSSTISFCLHELTQNPKELIKLQADIDATLKKHNGELTYECINEMKYLDLCVKETIRKYPALPILNRVCTKDYKIPDSEYVVKKGTSVIIPVMGIQMSPMYFPEPEVFNPERFTEEHKSFDEDAYFPFGEGPRACIGIRMGKMVVKIGLIMVLSKYHFEATHGDRLEYDIAAIGLSPRDGIHLKVSHRKL